MAVTALAIYLRIFSSQDERQIFETRQCFVDRMEEGPDCVDSFIEKAQSGQMSVDMDRYQSVGDELELLNRNSDTNLAGQGLPDAILRLDRRDAIPTPRHKNDVLLEIEASTVDRRDFMVRPGVRCTESLPQGITTTGMDCIGRVVQLTTHARAIYGISIDDRVAALYPFEYNYGCKDKGRRNKRYALVDAGFAVTVPKHVDAAEAACMVRLYLSAFQSIQKGLSLHDRYDFNQLKGQNVLVQNGQTELGRALIEMVTLLGASQVFATGPPEHHSLLMEMGAIPLGLDTFSWELFIEKISLVLVQDMPTAENFESYISILDAEKGNVVYIHHGHKHIDEDDLGIIADDVSCDGLHFQDLAEKARTIINSAKLSIRLACSLKYIEYEGVWPSCKGNQSQFKEDFRYLFTILGQGDLQPDVNEIIGLEEIAGVQDRIELLGKKGTIICLPTAIYEKKISVVSPENSPRRDHQGFPTSHIYGNTFSNSVGPLNTYASDAGYVKVAQAYDTLSDFHCMHDTTKHTPSIRANIALPALPEATSYSHSNSNHRTSFGAHHKSYIESHHNDASSIISSEGQNSATNISTSQTALSDGVLQIPGSYIEKDPPYSIQFQKKQTRRHRARQRWKKSSKHEIDTGEHENQEQYPLSPPGSPNSIQSRKKLPQHTTDTGEHEKQDQHPLTPPGSPGSIRSSQDKYVSSLNYSARKLRREARKRGQKKVVSTVSQMKENLLSEIVDVEDAYSEDRAPQTEQPSAAAVNVVEKVSVTKHVDTMADIDTRSLKSDRHSNTVHRTVSSYPSHDTQPTSGNNELQDSRNEDDDCARDDSASTSSFHSIMDKWKSIDNKNRVM